jgi:hypothetical protein
MIGKVMRYLVRARVIAGQEKALLRAVDEGTLGRGSIAGDEYLQDMDLARIGDDAIGSKFAFARLRSLKSVPIGRNTLNCCP